MYLEELKRFIILSVKKFVGVPVSAPVVKGVVCMAVVSWLKVVGGRVVDTSGAERRKKKHHMKGFILHSHRSCFSTAETNPGAFNPLLWCVVSV